VLEKKVGIGASPDRVWAVLTDFDAYPEWNPFITSIAGPTRAGERLVVDLTPPGGRTITMRPRVQVVESGRRFGWLGHLGVRGVFDGAHEFVIDPADDGGAVFTQRETFRGVLVPFVGRLLTRTEEGFAAMNAALKRRAERG
jgi:hypothetical protein